MIRYSHVELQPYLNATAATTDAERASGSLNAWGNSFPAEELPFGATLTIAGIPFQLQTGRERFDHVEALGQTVDLPVMPPASGIALLCFGEMGSQEVDLELYAGSSLHYRIRVTGRAWLIDGAPPEDEAYYLCSHLHYVGDYQLSLLRPVLWCRRFDWQKPATITKIVLGRNPLFHLFAVTCLHES
jgi:hypothetical protein